jgi:hypothetical protein
LHRPRKIAHIEGNYASQLAGVNNFLAKFHKFLRPRIVRGSGHQMMVNALKIKLKTSSPAFLYSTFSFASRMILPCKRSRTADNRKRNRVFLPWHSTRSFAAPSNACGGLRKKWKTPLRDDATLAPRRSNVVPVFARGAVRQSPVLVACYVRRAPLG